MKYLKSISLLLLMSFCIMGCQAKMPVKIYVSSSEGNDHNSGLTMSSPLKSISVAIKKGDEIYLKRGDVFYGNIELKDKKLMAYGNGSRPIISGFKRIIKPKWKKVRKNVWKINLREDNFTGVVTKGSSELNNIGCIHEYDKDILHGRKVENKKDLKKDWDMWQVAVYQREKMTPSQFDELFIYSKQNPNKLKLEFSTGVNGVYMKNSTIEDIEIRGFGRHGIAAYTQTIIRNCRIDMIGGMMQIGMKAFGSLGNGIEFWVNLESVENCLAENNYISRCFDCGITIQGPEGSSYTPKNILIRNNLISECSQGWEDFLHNGKQYDNCRFKNNTIVNCGNTSGFGYPDSRFIYCNVLGHNHGVRNGMIIEGNTFIGGNFYAASISYGDYKSNIWLGNTFITSRGHWLLGHYMGKKDVIYIPKERGKYKSIDEATEAAIHQYRQMTGDKTTRIEIKSEDEIQMLIKSNKARFRGM